MNRLLGALLVVATLAAALPSAQAQAPTGVTLTCPDLETPIPYMGSAELACSVSVGCLEMAGGATTTVTVEVQGPPTWLTAAPGTAPLDPMACITGTGFVSAHVLVALTASKDAPAVIDTPLSLVATVGQTASAPDAAIVTVAYNWDYTLTTDAKFPLTVTTPTVVFNLTVKQSSNARSMVMMEEVRTSAGVIAGLTSTVYESGPGKSDSKTFKVTYTPPTGEWETAKVDFMAYGHYLLLDSRSGPYDNGTAVSWTFTNGGVEPVDDGGDSKDSPAPVGALLALGLVALAAFARRRA